MGAAMEMRPDASPLTGSDGRRRATVGHVLHHLGSTFLTLVEGDPSLVPDVSAVLIYDAVDDQELPPGALILGVGLQVREDLKDVIARIGRRGGCGLVVREPVTDDPEVRAAAAAAGVVLLGLVRGATWTQLARLLDGLLTYPGLDDTDDPDTIAGLPAGDLFAVASAISSLLDAPVTIEDRSSRVLAFSERQDEADQPRIETILGRQVPERYTRLLEQRGTFRDLYRSERPIFVDLQVPSLSPRAAVAVRAGDEILGSIWVAVSEPLSPAREDALYDAANLVALHLLRLRAGADVERRLRADLIATALEGGRSAAAALARLGLSGQPLMVLALHIVHSGGRDGLPPARREAALVQATDALSVHLSAVHARTAVALLDDMAFALVPALGDTAQAERSLLRAAQSFLDRVGNTFDGRIGVGGIAESIDALVDSRRDAERALSVLMAEQGPRRVARLADVHTDVLLLEMAALAEADNYVPSSAVERLLDYDRRHSTDLLPSLRSWLDGLDAISSAKAHHVHVNTFRYRLRRIAEIAEVDLDDPEVRFAVMLELRLLDRMRCRTASTSDR